MYDQKTGEVEEICVPDNQGMLKNGWVINDKGEELYDPYNGECIECG